MRVNGAKADPVLQNCLSDLESNKVNPYAYELLLNYPFENEVNITRGDWLEICCDTTQCLPVPTGLKCKKSLPSFQCSRFGSGVFCSKIEAACCGMVGDRLITNNATKGNCTENGVTIDLVTFDDLKNKSYIRLDLYENKTDSLCRHSLWHAYCSWENNGWTYQIYNCKNRRVCWHDLILFLARSLWK